ncbi:hypothetical protein D3C73_969610 [compost metagenome]
MDKVLDMNQTVYELCSSHPDAMEIMLELGFKSIAEPGMLQTAGRFMTLAKGAKMKKIDPELIKAKFRSKGYAIIE